MIILIGLPGSGKTTQGKSLAKALNCPWVSMGELLRNSVDEEFQKQLLAGHVIDDRITLPILDKELNQPKYQNQEFILDGCPRSMEQAEWLLKESDQGRFKITAIIHLELDEKTIRERLHLRARADDTDEAIDERISEYQKVILPIIKTMADHGVVVHEVNGLGGFDAVSARIQSALKVEA